MTIDSNSNAGTGAAATIDSLAETLRGDVVGPDDDEYDEVRTVWNGLVDRRPAFVVRCRGAADVAKAIRWADENELELSVRGGGHHQSGSAIAEDGLVLDLSEMDGIRVDPEAQIAHVGPGCRVRDLLLETQQYGLATPTGSAGTVGISGSTLGGGIGWMRREYGLGIDALRSVDVVASTGELVRASADRDDDLFWAVRGGGGNVGVVTNFEFDLYEVGPVVAVLGVFYPGEKAEEVLARYDALAREAPDEVTTLALKSHVPGLPPMPEELVGEETVAIMGCHVGDVERGTEALRPFREITEPLLDVSEPMPYLALHELGSSMFPDGRNYCHRSVYLDDLSADVIDALVDHADEAASPLSGIGVWHMGGAIGDVGTDETAYPHRDREYMLTIEANWDEGDDDANLAWVREGDERLRELGGVGAYGGFTGFDPSPDEDVPGRVYGANLDRLSRVKEGHDATNAFARNVDVTPSTD